MAEPAPLILIVEDEPNIARIEAAYLEQAGYRTEWVDDGLHALPAVRRSDPALMVLDLMLPGRDGLDICRELRGFSALPVIMVTAKVEEIDRLLGLELGADDYLCKPFSPRELVARVKAVLRRAPAAGAGAAADGDAGVERGPFRVDEARMRITLRHNALNLTPMEFRLLAVLLRHPGRIWSRSQLLEQVQPDDLDSYDRVVDTHVKNLRKKLAEVAPGGNYIRSVYGIGYKLDFD